MARKVDEHLIVARLGKRVGERENLDSEVTNYENKRVMQAIRRDQCRSNNDYHTKTMGQSIVFRLGAGDNRLKKHMNRTHMSPTPHARVDYENRLRNVY